MSSNWGLCCISLLGREWVHLSTLCLSEKKTSFPGNEETLHCCELIQILSGRPFLQGRFLRSRIFGICVPVHPWCGLTVIKRTCCLQKPGHAPPPVLCWSSLTAGLGLSIRVFVFLSHHSTLESWFTETDCSDFRGIRLSWALWISRWTCIPSNEEPVDANLKRGSNTSQPRAS